MKDLRILLCKGGMDGHTRPIRLLAREFRDAGFEVVLTDMYQSPEEICAQALQEDPDIIAISMHTRGHNRFFTALSSILKRKKVFEDFALAAGGVIPQKDYSVLEELGVRLISSPGESIVDSVIPKLRELAMSIEKEKGKNTPKELFSALKKGNTAALSRFITFLTKGSAEAGELAESKTRKNSFSVGFSGNGGVGKSSLLGELIELLRPKRRLGILCVDPVAISGGAVLADRIRFQTYELTTDPNVFIRSIVSRDTWRGVTKETPAIIKAMRHARREVVLVESVGSGQMDVGFNKVVDTFVYVASPDMGDEMQMLKGGAIERADIIVINKADKEGTSRIKAALKDNFGRRVKGGGWSVPIISTIASGERNKEDGIGDLWEAIEQHRDFLKNKQAPEGRKRKSA